MSEFFFHLNNVDEAKELVIKYHYSKRPPANIQVVGSWHEAGGLFGNTGDMVAACFFSIPPTRWSEEVWELSRLVRKDDVKCQLSGLISDTCKYIKKNKLIDLLVSFADYTQKHHGGIYQSCSWNFNCKREAREDGLIINGIFRPARSLNSYYGTSSSIKLQTIHPDWKIEKHIDDGKYLYWRALNKSGMEKAERLNLKSLPYPKPDKN